MQSSHAPSQQPPSVFHIPRVNETWGCESNCWRAKTEPAQKSVVPWPRLVLFIDLSRKFRAGTWRFANGCVPNHGFPGLLSFWCPPCLIIATLTGEPCYRTTVCRPHHWPGGVKVNSYCLIWDPRASCMCTSLSGKHQIQWHPMAFFSETDCSAAIWRQCRLEPRGNHWGLGDKVKPSETSPFRQGKSTKSPPSAQPNRLAWLRFARICLLRWDCGKSKKQKKQKPNFWKAKAEVNLRNHQRSPRGFLWNCCIQLHPSVFVLKCMCIYIYE